MIFGFLNSVLAKRLDPTSAFIIHGIYFIYENHVRAFMVIIGSVLTIKIVRNIRKNGKISRFRLVCYSSFSISVIILLIIIPSVTGFMGFYSVFMPFPWSSAPFQIYMTGAYYNSSFIDVFGSIGVFIGLLAFFIYQAVSFTGTVILGRRWHCSMICPLAGCHSETFGEVIPFVTYDKDKPKAKKLPRALKNLFKGFQVVFIFINGFILVMWIMFLFNDTLFSLWVYPLLQFELWKYLIFEMYFMVIGWILIGGRCYCYFCPSGTVLGFIGKAVGQEITTGLTKCTECGLCNDVCKMSIDIKSRAIEGKPVKTIDCVGCGLCIEACPQNNLQYTTRLSRKYEFLRKID